MGKIMDHKDEWETDYNVVQQSLTNDKVWKTIYYKAYPKVNKHVKRILRSNYISGYVAEDVVADAFESCYRKRSEFQGKSKFSTWACKFGEYKALNAVAKSKRYMNHIDRYTDYSVCSDIASDPYRYITIRHQHKCLWTAYESLKTEYQILIDWKILGERTATEAMLLTGLNRAERKYYLDVAIKILRKRYLELYSNYW